MSTPARMDRARKRYEFTYGYTEYVPYEDDKRPLEYASTRTFNDMESCAEQHMRACSFAWVQPTMHEPHVSPIRVYSNNYFTHEVGKEVRP